MFLIKKQNHPGLFQLKGCISHAQDIPRHPTHSPFSFWLCRLGCARTSRGWQLCSWDDSSQCHGAADAPGVTWGEALLVESWAKIPRSWKIPSIWFLISRSSMLNDVQLFRSFSGQHGLLILFQSDVYQHPSDLEERCREDPDLVLAAVSGDGRCLALSSLQYDESFVREVRWVVWGTVTSNGSSMTEGCKACKSCRIVIFFTYDLLIFCMTFWARQLHSSQNIELPKSHPIPAGSLLQCRGLAVCSRALEGADGPIICPAICGICRFHDTWILLDLETEFGFEEKTLVWIYYFVSFCICKIYIHFF